MLNKLEAQNKQHNSAFPHNSASAIRFELPKWADYVKTGVAKDLRDKEDESLARTGPAQRGVQPISVLRLWISEGLTQA